MAWLIHIKWSLGYMYTTVKCTICMQTTVLLITTKHAHECLLIPVCVEMLFLILVTCLPVLASSVWSFPCNSSWNDIPDAHATNTNNPPGLLSVTVSVCFFLRVCSTVSGTVHPGWLVAVMGARYWTNFAFRPVCFSFNVLYKAYMSKALTSFTAHLTKYGLVCVSVCSGAGKTTFLNALCGRTSGNLTVGGKYRN